MRIERLGVQSSGRERVLPLPPGLSIITDLTGPDRRSLTQLLLGGLLGNEPQVPALTYSDSFGNRNVIHGGRHEAPLEALGVQIDELRRKCLVTATDLGLPARRAQIARTVPSARVEMPTHMFNAPPSAELVDELEKARDALVQLDAELQAAWADADHTDELRVELDRLSAKLSELQESAARRLWARAWFDVERLRVEAADAPASQAQRKLDQQFLIRWSEVSPLLEDWRRAWDKARELCGPDRGLAELREQAATPLAPLVQLLASVDQDRLWPTARAVVRADAELDAATQDALAGDTAVLESIDSIADRRSRALDAWDRLAPGVDPQRAIQLEADVRGASPVMDARRALASLAVADQAGAALVLNIGSEPEFPFDHELLANSLESLVAEAASARRRSDARGDEPFESELSVALEEAEARLARLHRPEWTEPPTLDEINGDDPELVERRVSELRTRLSTRHSRDELDHLADRRIALARRVTHLESLLAAPIQTASEPEAEPTIETEIEFERVDFDTLRERLGRRADLAQVGGKIRKRRVAPESLPLILDDPFGALSVQDRLAAMAELERLAQRNQIILLTDDPELQAFARRNNCEGVIDFPLP